MDLDIPRLRSAYETARDLLLAECRSDGSGPAHWTGELSTSALSTATAVMALQMVRRGGRNASNYGIDGSFDELVRGGLGWLKSHQNDDGGWGDTVKSLSNISTTMLAHAVFHATCTAEDEAFRETVTNAKRYIDDAGGVPAVVKRYGKDKTFSVPILTHCALAGLVDWHEVTQLPFELSCVPARFYAAVKMPVVSYALPALIAIGQVRHHFLSTWNPITLALRNMAIKPSLRVLERIQPPNGGFLEAAPLTSFVTMSLAGMGLVDHIVVQRAVRFLADSVRPDGSWPIDTNLATWVTTLSVNALKDDVPEELRDGLTEWLLDQQYKETHPYTNAAPGGWAWTNLPGGVPDADDTPGAVLALQNLVGWVEHREAHQSEDQMGATAGLPSSESEPETKHCRTSRQWHPKVDQAQQNAVRWLLDLQNRDGGFPTFCRGWGTLPFDRSSPDITAHCLRAIARWLAGPEGFDINVLSGLAGEKLKYLVARYADLIDAGDIVAEEIEPDSLPKHRAAVALDAGLQFLLKRQRPDGSWLPLWFGNQYGHDDGNPVYGTSRVLMAYRDLGLMDAREAQRAAAWLASVQEGCDVANSGDGGPLEARPTLREAGSPLTPALSPKRGEGASVPGSTLDPLPSGGTAGLPSSESEAETEHCATGRKWQATSLQASSSARGPQPSALDRARGWGGDAGIAPSVEETSLAAEVLLDYEPFRPHAFAGIQWLIERVEDGTVAEPTPIGFYFARLWYFESLYPLIFAVSALRRALEIADLPAEP
ncbi:MAG: prenyltransferase/squalene oxidase repeat-containing protein [Planctomycetota bacterium]|jgi:squalene-hopene/tetraprenyl-beta-curcumene cyclase